ncbi:MAG: hypothetical protein ACRCWR_08250 [Saezia sp.]
MDTSKILSDIVGKLEPLMASFEGFAQEFSRPVRAKLLLVINHVVSQNPQALERLKVHAGRTVVFENPLWSWPLVITLAGLFEEGVADNTGASEKAALAKVDLRVKMKIATPSALMETLLKGTLPLVDIEGDADIAATFAWLGKNLRWDYEKDLSSIIGESPLPMAVEQLKVSVEMFRGVLDSVSQWLDRSKNE